MCNRVNSDEHLLFQQMNDGIVLLNREFSVEYANPSFLSLIQATSLEDISGSDFYEFAATAEDLILLREWQTSSLVELSLSTKSGEVVPVEISVSPRVDQQGGILGYIVAVRNIVLRRNLRDRLQQTMEKYRDMAHCGFDWLWEVDSAGTFTFVSPSVREVMGYSPEELFGQTPFDLMTEEEVERIASVFNRIASRNESFKNLVSRCLTRNGDEVVVTASGIPLFDEDGKLKGYRGGDRDITEEVRTAELLKNTLATAEQILECLPVGVVLVDRNKRIRQINERACTVLGRARKELLGEMCHSALCPALMNQCPILDHEKKIDRAAHFALHKDGHVIPVVKSVIPVQLDSEDFLLEVFVDVSEIKSLKQKNIELSLAIDNLKKSAIRIDSRSRKHHGELLLDKIAALGCINGTVDLLLETEQTDEQSSLLTAVQANCRKLTNGVRFMQDKMGGFQRAFPLEMNEFLLRKLLELAIAPFRGRGLKKGVDIDLQIDPLLPDLFFGPARGIEGVLQALLGISLFRASDDTIEIGITYVSSLKERTMQIRFSVGFSGAGVFKTGVRQLFTDADLSAMDSRTATCKEFAREVGGEFHTRDTPGSDFAFWLTIPLERCENRGAAQKDILKGVRVLIMENDTQLRSVYLKMLQSGGCRVTAVADRKLALIELRKAAERDDPVQIAVLGCDFSENDGLITARLIRNDGIIGNRTDLVICSSQIKTGDIEEYQQEGYSALLRKPLSLSTLRNCLIEVLSRSGENLPIITEYSLP